jgi:type IV pilus biogenesis protein CpaD/CtpE
MNVLRPSLLVVATLLVAGCATTPKASPTPLQIQAYQTKEFEVDKTIALGAVISVFQDLGYIVQSADKDTGFITATSPNKSNSNLLFALAGTSRTGHTKATAFLEQIRPKFTSVRLNFVVNERMSTEKGQLSEEDTPVTDPKTYQIAFNRIEDAIFVRTGTQPAASPAPPGPAAQAAQ